MKWYIGPIDPYIDDIKTLFAQNHNHKHADNYLKWPLFEYTKFARLAWDDGKLIYYSAGIERPEYDGSIRIMSRHTRCRNYDFGGWRADLNRGLQTLEESTKYAIELGYSEIWISREEGPELLYYFQKHSSYDWEVEQEMLPGETHVQWVMRYGEPLVW